MEMLAQQIANGLILGSVYALIALGYTMVYGILGLINFAHGEITMMGAMIAVAALNIFLHVLHLPPLLALSAAICIAIPCCMLLGVTIERIAYRPLRHAPKLASLITAIGVSIVLQNVAMMVWGRGYQRFPDIIPAENVSAFGATLTPVKIAIVLLSACTLLGLWLLVNRTRLGRAMRATAQNPEAAQLMGVAIDKVIAATFAIGSALGALAGIMVAANYGQADPYMGFLLGLKAFSAAVLGGIGNLAGAVIGGLLLGLIESLGAGYLGTATHGVFGSNYQDIFAFMVLVAVLVLRPSGLLGEHTAERA
ncbi:MAG TPA: branched-chain amino acid ABC transporter permease [Pseudomonadales bacterium]|nr:branched-chain amino acid ABC transporter permease [Pseudomonadales bacterium]